MLNHKIYHEDRNELSENNVKIVNNIQTNQDIKVANELLAQAYLFLNKIRKESAFLKHDCLWCDGCRNVDEYSCDSMYCLHAHDCPLAEFVIDKIEKRFK